MRTPEEVEALSRTFSADWRTGDHVMTRLKRHEGKTQELSNLVRDGWSWTDVGRAMAGAGIHYRSGEAMSAAILRKKASEARAAIRSRDAGPNQGRATIKAPSNPDSGLVDIEFWNALRSKQVAGQAAQAVVARNGPVEDEEPEFRPVRLRKHPPAPTQLPDMKADAEEGPAPASSLSNTASLVSAGKRILERTRAALRQEPRAPETAEERQARIDRLLSQCGPEAPRRRTGKR